MGVLVRGSKRHETLGMSKRGQLQIQETIITVFIFIVLIMFGMIFFYRVQSSSIEKDFLKFQNDKLSVDFITLGDLPEFSCSKLGIKEDCIDTVKLISFINVNNIPLYKSYYFTKFGYKNITIRQIYPKIDGQAGQGTNVATSVFCNSSKLTDCNSWQVYLKLPVGKPKTKLIRDTPVSLYFPDKDQYGIGVLTVEAYDI